MSDFFLKPLMGEGSESIVDAASLTRGKKILAHICASAQTCVHRGENINQINNDANPFISI